MLYPLSYCMAQKYGEHTEKNDFTKWGKNPNLEDRPKILQVVFGGE